MPEQAQLIMGIFTKSTDQAWNDGPRCANRRWSCSNPVSKKGKICGACKRALRKN